MEINYRKKLEEEARALEQAKIDAKKKAAKKK